MRITQITNAAASPYRETATPTPPAHHPRLVCAVQGRSELQRILVDVLRARSARFPFGAPGGPSGPQGPLGYFRRHSCRKIRVILPSPAPTAGRTTKHATLCVRGVKFSMPGTKRVRVLGAPRPWTSEGSSFPRRGPGGFEFSAILTPRALKGSSFRFPRRRRAACNGARG